MAVRALPAKLETVSAKSTNNLTVSKTGKPSQLSPYNDHKIKLIFSSVQVGHFFALTASLD